MSLQRCPQLKYRGYLFNKDSVRKNKIYWRCIAARRSTCTARLLTIDKTVVETQPEHDHLPEDGRSKRKSRFSLNDINKVKHYEHFADLI